MRESVRLLDTRDLPWEPLGAPGLFTRRLARDPLTGERTALQRAVPDLGQRPPGQAHFHSTYEEILVVRGSMSFDSVQWLQPHGYLYHPPRTVHGFKSALRGETWFLSRVGHDLDFTFVPDPPQTSPYYVGDTVPARGWTYVPDPDSETWPLQATPPQATETAAFAGATARTLSVDPSSGEGSLLVRLPSGWRGRPDAFARRRYLEMFVLEGGLELADGTGIGGHGYAHRTAVPEGAPVASDAGAVVYVNLGALDREG
jgi:hypothetical protein